MRLALSSCPPDDIMEVFSPPRVVPVAARLGLRASLSLDLLHGHDFMTFSGRSNAIFELQRRRPRMLIVSPPCTMYSALQHMWNIKKMAPDTLKERWAEAETLLSFAMLLCSQQVAASRTFVHEHPRYAKSWAVKEVIAVEQLPGVQRVSFDQCRFGLEGPVSGQAIRKSTSFLTNNDKVKSTFDRVRCNCIGKHLRIMGSEHGTQLSTHCAHYPRPLCEALARCLP